MKLHFILSAASLAAAVALPEPELSSGKVSYDGYKMFHVEVGDLEGYSALESLLAGLPDAIPIEACTSHSDHLDVAVPAHSLNAFDALNLTSTVIHEDLGAAIAAEGALEPYLGQLPSHVLRSVYTHYIFQPPQRLAPCHLRRGSTRTIRTLTISHS